MKPDQIFSRIHVEDIAGALEGPIKDESGYRLIYPTYREGLTALLATLAR